MMGTRRRASAALRRWHRITMRHSRSERGASLVEYALLVGLIAIVAVVAVGFLGTSVSNLFTHEANCIGTPGGTNLQSGQSVLQQAQSLGTGHGSTNGVALTSLDSQSNGAQSGNGNQLSTGLQINGGNPPDAPSCGATNDGNQNQQQILKLLQ